MTDMTFHGTTDQLVNALTHMATKRPITKTEKAIVSEAAAHIAAQDAKIAKLVKALRLISSHRRRCHEHDEDMGRDLREFDLEDLKLMEQAARQAIASIGETDD